MTAQLIRYRPTKFPRAGVCYDCGATIPAHTGCWRRIDSYRDYPVVCQPREHGGDDGPPELGDYRGDTRAEDRGER